MSQLTDEQVQQFTDNTRDGTPQQVERVSEADRMLIIRMNARIASLQAQIVELQQFVTGHLSVVYGLGDGDGVKEDGLIVRTSPPESSAS